jgi:K+-transporting ATPase ATPase C chain
MKTIFTALKAFIILTILTGVFYPLLITVLSRVFFNDKSQGSLLIEGNVIRGSKLIGQGFDSVIYFSTRPSAVNYGTLPSGGSNLAYTDIRLKKQFEERKSTFISDNMLDSTVLVPAEMLFASASGLDPHISLRSALLQADRVATARRFNTQQKEVLLNVISGIAERPQYMCFGTEKVNVLLLNLETDKIK